MTILVHRIHMDLVVTISLFSLMAIILSSISDSGYDLVPLDHFVYD